MQYDFDLIEFVTEFSNFNYMCNANTGCTNRSFEQENQFRFISYPTHYMCPEMRTYNSPTRDVLALLAQPSAYEIGASVLVDFVILLYCKSVTSVRKILQR